MQHCAAGIADDIVVPEQRCGRGPADIEIGAGTRLSASERDKATSIVQRPGNRQRIGLRHIAVADRDAAIAEGAEGTVGQVPADGDGAAPRAAIGIHLQPRVAASNGEISCGRDGRTIAQIKNAVTGNRRKPGERAVTRRPARFDESVRSINVEIGADGIAIADLGDAAAGPLQHGPSGIAEEGIGAEECGRRHPADIEFGAGPRLPAGERDLPCIEQRTGEGEQVRLGHAAIADADRAAGRQRPAHRQRCPADAIGIKIERAGEPDISRDRNGTGRVRDLKRSRWVADGERVDDHRYRQRHGIIPTQPDGHIVLRPWNGSWIPVRCDGPIAARRGIPADLRHRLLPYSSPARQQSMAAEMI